MRSGSEHIKELQRALQVQYPARHRGYLHRQCVAHALQSGSDQDGDDKNSSYDTHLYKLCDECGVDHFCMHALRHTYATRAIEYGMQPKVLQKLLGHKSLKTTMDRYVHVTEDSLDDVIRNFGKCQIITLGGSKVGQTAVWRNDKRQKP